MIGDLRKEKIMKKALIVFALLAMLTLALAATVVFAEEEKLKTDKTEYTLDEPIMVTAIGSGKDWVGIYYPDEPHSLYWGYIEDVGNYHGVGSGTPFDIKNAPDRNNDAPASLSPGDYVIRLMPNDSTDISKAIASINIKIKANDDAPANSSGGDMTKLNVPKASYAFDEAIKISAIGSGKDWVGIYYPDAEHSLYWAYVDASANKGIGSGVEFDIKKAPNKSNSAPATLPAGEYIIRLMPNDSENIADAIAWTTVTIQPKEGTTVVAKDPLKPVSAEYKLKNNTDGFSEGQLTIKVSEDNPAKDVVCYWADNSGKLEGYTALAKFKIKGQSTVFNVPGSTLIPEGATKLLVYTALNGKLSADCFEITLPEGAASKSFGTPILEFQVVSDVHIQTNNNNRNNKHYVEMLKDIVKTCPNSKGLFIVGDMADSGNKKEFDNLMSLHSSVNGAPALYMAIGNHDLYNGSLADKSAQFLSYAKLPDGSHPDSVHYDFWQDGYHYVFLGNDKLVDGVRCTLDKDTLKWLDDTLAKDRDAGRPTFLFLHQSIYNTVSGSLSGQGWDGIVNAQDLKNVLKKYPEVIMFNGHSHWTLDSESCMYERSKTLPSIFNTGSVAYLWTSYDVRGGENLEGSQGYYIRIYEDKVAVLGRDFVTGEWVSSAQFVVDYGGKHEILFANQGIGDAISSLKVTSGSTVTLPTPTAEGYIFEGWYTDSGYRNEFDPATVVYSDMVLYAKWKEDPNASGSEKSDNIDISALPLIIGISVGALVLIGGAFTAVLVLKKKKQQ